MVSYEYISIISCYALLKNDDIVSNIWNLSTLYKLPFSGGFAMPQAAVSQSAFVVPGKLFPLAFFTTLPF